MSQLEPNTNYIYEKADGITYARKFGSKDRFVIGYDIDSNKKEEDVLWQEIRQAAKTNRSLQKALDRAKMLYRLSKDDPL